MNVIQEFLTEMTIPKQVYHGSSVQGLKEIKPMNVTTDPKWKDRPKFVLAGVTMDMASCFTFHWDSYMADCGKWYSGKEGQWIFKIKKRHEYLLDKSPCSIYILSGSTFIDPPSDDFEGEVVSKVPVKVIKEIRYKTPREAMRKNGVDIQIVENLREDFLRKHGFLEEGDARFEFIPNNLKNINEKIGILFSGDHTVYDWEQFVNRKKPLIIVGLSGAGKSTIGAALAKKMNCPYIEEDKIENTENEKSSKYILEALSKYKFFVYEGMEISDLCTEDNDSHKIVIDINKYSFIILSSSLVQASIRAYKRDGKLGKDIWKKFLFNRNIRNWLNQFEKMLDKTKLTKTTMSTKELLS